MIMSHSQELNGQLRLVSVLNSLSGVSGLSPYIFVQVQVDVECEGLGCAIGVVKVGEEPPSPGKIL
jgi:hypothetical protein